MFIAQVLVGPRKNCKIKETLSIQELKPSLNVNIISEKLLILLIMSRHVLLQIIFLSVGSRSLLVYDIYIVFKNCNGHF